MLLSFALALVTASGAEFFAGMGLLFGFIAGATGVAGIVHTSRTDKIGRPAAILGAIVGALLVIVLVIVILLPPMGQPREAAQRIKCASHLRQVGQALRAYVMDHGAYPPDFETLVANSDLVDEVFICPSGEYVPGPPPYQLGKNCDFMYLASGFGPNVPGHQIVVIEPVLYPAKEGQLPAGHVLHADGSVHLLTEAQARTLFTAPFAPERDPAAPVTQPASPPAPSR